MNLLISTIDRASRLSPCYLHQTLSSMLLSGMPLQPIHLMVDGNDEYLSNYKNNKYIQIHKWQAEQQIFSENLPNKYARAAFNYHRCLTFQPDVPALILEDDIIFADGWYDLFRQAVEFLGEGKYLLAVFHNEPINVSQFQLFLYQAEPTKIDNNIGQVRLWGNTQCVYYSSEILQSGMAEHLYLNSVSKSSVDALKTGFHDTAKGGIYDAVISEYCWRNNIPIYLLAPCPIKHIGIMSSCSSHNP